MTRLFKKLLTPRHLEYLIVDANWTILEISSGVQRFADRPDEAIAGKDVCLAFPELIGTEEILQAVLQGEHKSFELRGIGRFSERDSPLYMDFYVNEYRDEDNFEKRLIIFFEDVTERMILEQKLVQSTNETSLLVSALSQSESYINKIITSMAEALIVTNVLGKIKTVNIAAQNLFEYQKEELVGQPISRIISDQLFLNIVMQEGILSDGELLKDIEVVCHTKTGKKVFVEFSCSLVQTDIQDLQDFLYIGRDITDRQRTQQRLAAQYATARVLSESATLKQAIPKILLGICESLGWTLGELWMPKPENLSLQNPPYDTEQIVLKCVEVWSRPSTVIKEFIEISNQISFAPGEGLPGLVWATNFPQWIADVVHDDRFQRRAIAAKVGLHAAFGFPIQSDREILGVMTFFSTEVKPFDEELLHNIAAIGSQLGQFIKRKQAEEALRESEERYRDLFENASDLIQSVGADGHFLYVNRAWRETLGYSEAEIAHLSVFDIIHPDHKAHCLDVFRRVMSGENFAQIQAKFIRKDAKKISVEGNISCKFVEGKPVATRAIFRDITERLKTEEELRHQQEQTEGLLLNILPEAIADRLKKDPSTIAESFADVTVLFADIVGFTQISSYLSPIELVSLLNQIFSAFDRLSELHGLEKIKTIGDAYMVVGGLPIPGTDRAEAIAEMALDMLEAIAQFNLDNHQAFSIRIGIHSGSVVAGVIGIKKFIYDLWGDTVNLASRMESHGLSGKIQVSDVTYELLRDRYLLEKRGTIQIKGKGEMTTYFLLGRKDESCSDILEAQRQDCHQSMRSATQRIVEQLADKLRDI